MSKRFSDLGVNDLLQKGLDALQISAPTAIQQKTIPLVLDQTEDLVAVAKTGTGKTAAFGIPLLQLIEIDNPNVQVVILAPTRELGQQIHANLVSYAAKISINFYCCHLWGHSHKTSNRTLKNADSYCGGNTWTFGRFNQSWCLKH